MHLWDSCQHHPVSRDVGAVRVGREHVDVLITRPSIVPAVVQKRWTAKAIGEFPVAPPPRLPVIGGPGELRVVHVPDPHIENAAHRQHPAGLGALRAKTVAFAAL